jgi:plastocyanin
MSRRLLATLVVAATGLAVAGAAFSQAQSTPRLVGTVGPGYTIKLTKAGVKVRSLKAGTYKFVISDKSSFHNFTLEKETGAKVEKHLTGTSFTGSKTMTLTLKAGKWKYYCSVHEPQMFGYFTVK